MAEAPENEWTVQINNYQMNNSLFAFCVLIPNYEDAILSQECKLPT